MGFVRGREVESCFDGGVAHGNRAARGEDDFLPEAHVLVGRRRIPIDPGDAEFVGVGRGDFYGDDIFCAGFDVGRDIEFIAAKRADDLIRAGDFFAVDPDVRAVIDSAKRHPNRFPIKLRGNFELFAIPPGDSVGTIFRYFQIGELAANRIRHTGDGTQIHAEIGIFVDAVFDEHGEHRVGGGRFVPGGGVKTCGGDGFAGGCDFGGGLNSPTFTQRDIAIGSGERRGDGCGGEERSEETQAEKEDAARSGVPKAGAFPEILCIATWNHRKLPCTAER